MHTNKAFSLARACLTAGYTHDKFVKSYTNVFNEEDSVLNTLFAKNNVDVDAKTNEFYFALNEERINIEFLPKAHRVERTKLHNRMRNAIAETEFKILSGNEKVYKHPYSSVDARDFPTLFGERIQHPEGSPNGLEVAYILSDENKTPEEKNQAFSQYIDELYSEFEKANVPSSDEEFIKKYPALREISTAFMLDNITLCFERLANCKLDPKVKANYEGYKSMAQKSNMTTCFRAAKIGDPTYCYMNEENMLKLAGKVNDNLAVIDLNGFKSKEFGIKNDTSLSVHNYNLANDIGITNDKIFEMAERRGIIKEGSTFIGANGEIDRKTGTDLFRNHEYLGVFDRETGKMKAVSINNEFNLVSIDIADNYNKKAAFKKMLNELNKGTSIINKSSPEYKNMRNILADLSNGKGNENELLTSLKENSSKYLENYFKKERLSGIAKKRRECVLNMLNQLEVFEMESTLGESMRECKTNSNQIVGEVQRQQVIINDNIKNSSGSFLEKNSDEKVKQFVSENDMANK